VRGDRPGSNRRRGDHSPGCFRLHHGHHDSKVAGTTGLEPAASRLTSERSARLSYAPKKPARSSAGGIRTHGLELMRLARTAAPPPRKSGRQESNLRSPAPEAGGVPSPPRPDANENPRRESNPHFRVEGPASSPFDHRGLIQTELRRQGSNLPLAINSRASYPLDHAGTREGEGVEPPRPGGPPVFETGYRANGSPSATAMAPAGVEPAPSRVRTGSSAV
jgi:hypothetical protein